MAAPPPGWLNTNDTLAARVARTTNPTPARQVGPAGDSPAAEFEYDHTIDGLRGIPLTDLACVDAAMAAKFDEFGITSVYHLLTHVPLRYIDRSQVTPINQMRVGEVVTGIGIARSVGRIANPGKQPFVAIEVDDGTGAVSCTFFNQDWRMKSIRHGDEVIIHGTLGARVGNNGRQYLTMTSPMLDRIGSKRARIIPVYPQSAKSGITTWDVHRAAQEAVRRLGPLADPIPDGIGRDLMARVDAYRLIHLPDEPGQEAPARDRLAYDELLRMQLALQMHRIAETDRAGVTHTPTGALTRPLLGKLPFPLTGAQQRALKVIANDLRSPKPMHRLLQGDVGAGKTLVAAMTLLMAVEGGYQGALMAPTEILATQHFDELVRLLDGVSHPDGRPVQVATLTSRVMTRARRAALAGLAEGSIDLVVGTHSLLSDEVVFARLGCAVVDEQHRFGVEQRMAMAHKGSDGCAPDLLVMTATPIPRTAAMTVFGDLDLVVLDELPPGRTPIHTEWQPHTPDPADPDDPAWQPIKAAVAAGRQAYVVCPLVEDSEKKAAASATATRDALDAGALHGLRIGLVHGKLTGDEKTAVMGEFSAGRLDVLVATTVIEVGVNVPNATVIVVLEPKSFGIAQLHQLRGRVGRGSHASMCVLAGEAKNADTERRLSALVATTDGFLLADADLEIRGPGELLGARQHGMTDLRVASLATDRALIGQARDDAAAILARDPRLGRHPVLRHEVKSALGGDAAQFLTAS